MAQKINIEIEQGATFSKEVELYNEDDSDFIASGWTGRGQLRKHYTSNSYHSFNVSLSNALCVFAMTASTTANISGGLYVYDVEIESSENVVRKIISGMAIVTPEVTK